MPKAKKRRTPSVAEGGDPSTFHVEAPVPGDSSAGELALAVPPEASATLPELIPLLPLRSDVVFPQTVVPLVVNRAAGIKLIDDVLGADKMLGLITQRQPDTDEPLFDELYPCICVGSILKML